jgi:hypothetical protein
MTELEYVKNLLLEHICKNCRSYMEFIANSFDYPLMPRCIHPNGKKLKDNTCEEFKAKSS